ncbi:MmcQ/YjbR family DNA-binding protein [Mariniphaga sediminis]|jgi:predicted DNA-binding protein (MmcQ/YjbR family)|uniref:MmcQ/YjbR family DNA-binding protein n=1 Tax=Mariniphaga sediminis TaxID=1628158 RepID=A0A399D3Q8_9BACT|nr:MmcQ/YjbR family DNA-binding protein [Mariniphaga sediminis]RIH65050.1 MmcQ/YjbR family DNA-binding protein [Mariniphaga sediminis]
MNIEELRDYCLSMKGAEEKMPFDNKTLVFSVKGKMFCATDVEDYELINLKCNPEEAILLREKYEDVIPGYYMNKKHWNSIKTNGSISDTLLEEWIRNSYNLVVAALPKKVQKELAEE